MVSPEAARRWPEIDGLRAVAVTAVLLFHLQLPGFSLGWAGVNLFFVISGFLITGILLKSRDTRDFFKNFYIRRALRIFPIYYLVFAAIAVWAVARDANIDDAGYYALYLQNIPLGSGNWQSAFPGFFTHTWSLAIEEQFYWLWPLLIWRATPRGLAWTLLGFFIASLTWRCYAQAFLPDTAWFATSPLSQLDALSAGAALSLMLHAGAQPHQLRQLGGLVLLLSLTLLSALVLAIGYANLWRPDLWIPHSGSPLVYTALAIVFSAVLVLAISEIPVLSAGLRSRLLRHIGVISYGLYLYHFPAFAAVDAVAARVGPEFIAPALDIVKLLVTYLIALVSWHWFEQPFLALKERWAKRDDRVIEGSR
jgi:peptidoglycan/LPS O-acetylase OafA/YrhL